MRYRFGEERSRQPRPPPDAPLDFAPAALLFQKMPGRLRPVGAGGNLAFASRPPADNSRSRVQSCEKSTDLAAVLATCHRSPEAGGRPRPPGPRRRQHQELERSDAPAGRGHRRTRRQPATASPSRHPAALDGWVADSRAAPVGKR